jgi:hypothetical protein
VRAGYSFSKASETSQLSTGLDFTRRRERRYLSLAFDADSSDSAGGEEQSDRAYTDARYYYLLPERWLVGGFATLEFRFDTPELDITMRLELYPNLSDTGSYRTSFDTDFRWEIISDLF